MKSKEENKKIEKPQHKKNKEIEKLEEENKILNDKFLRLVAEMQNVKRRGDEEILNLRKYEGEEFIKKILVIVDDLERAINMDDDNLDDEVSNFLKGFKMLYVNLINILKAEGVEEIDCLGKQFDPSSMQAVMTEKVLDKESNTVVDILQKGYVYNGKVIRPAMVKVNE